MKNLIAIFTLLLIASTANADMFARATTDNLNVRSAPAGDRIAKLNQGRVVAILESEGNWARVMYLINNNPEDPQTGWVSAKYLSVFETSPSVKQNQVAMGSDSAAQ